MRASVTANKTHRVLKLQYYLLHLGGSLSDVDQLAGSRKPNFNTCSPVGLIKTLSTSSTVVAGDNRPRWTFQFLPAPLFVNLVGFLYFLTIPLHPPDFLKQRLILRQ